MDDYETWIEGGVMPTLNAFDNGEDERQSLSFILTTTMELEFKETQ